MRPVVFKANLKVKISSLPVQSATLYTQVFYRKEDICFKIRIDNKYGYITQTLYG